MGMQSLSDTMAFSPGADLWILPDPKTSHWARRIDWYLNFQLARAENHRQPVLETGLLQLLREEELAPPTTVSDNRKPLLVSSHHRLPAAQTVELPFGGDFSDWVTRAADIWRDLDKPPLRLFLPQGVSAGQAEAQWPESKAKNREVTVVADREAAGPAAEASTAKK
jgi:hypothetical protein